VTRQERTARATRKAAEQAETIIAEATSKARRGDQDKRCPVCRTVGDLAWLKANGHGKRCTSTPRVLAEAIGAQIDAKPRAKVTAGARVVRKPDAASDPLGAQCLELREQGLSWMAIGAKLGLPGAKSGAAAARKLYAAHTGQSHRAAPGLPKAPRARRHAAQVGSKASRRERVQLGTGLISDDMPDEAVVTLLAGKTIQWAIDLKRLADGRGEPEWAEQEAKVHPTYIRIEFGKLEERCVRFREHLGEDKHGNVISGPTRTVRLAAIHTVR
jgi:hypothetical protein